MRLPPKRLNDFCIVEYGTRVVRKNDQGSAYPVYGGGGATFRLDSFNREDRLVVARFGLSERCTRFVTGKFFLNDSGLTVSPRDAQILDQRFLDYQLVARNDVIYRLSRGTAQRNLDVEAFRELEITVPSLAEQQRIIAILDEAFAGIDAAVTNAEKNLANARELFDSYLGHAFADNNQDWTHTTIGGLVNQAIIARPLDGNHGGIHPKKAEFTESGVPFIMAGDLVDGAVDQTNCHFLSRQQADGLRKGFAKDGDVLLSHKGTIGRVAVLETNHDYVMLTPQVTYYRVRNPAVLLNRYIYHFFKSARFQDEINRIAGGGSTRAYIGITSQLQLHFSFPPIEEQRRLVTVLDALTLETSRLCHIYTRGLQLLAELKQSILQKAFAGELTAKEAEREMAAA